MTLSGFFVASDVRGNLIYVRHTFGGRPSQARGVPLASTNLNNGYPDSADTGVYRMNRVKILYLTPVYAYSVFTNSSRIVGDPDFKLARAFRTQCCKLCHLRGPPRKSHTVTRSEVIKRPNRR